MRSSSNTASAWARVLAFMVAIFTTLAVADVKFIEPSAGANLTAGQIDVRWEDSGISPPISELTQYTLSLMVGGNNLNDMQPVATFESQGTYSAGSSAHGTIPDGIAANVPNGFFFRMTSTKEAGGVLINYSDRFSISGLIGDTALRIKQAAQALDGDTDGPPAEGNNVSSTTSSSMATSSETASSTSSGTLTSSATTGVSTTSNPPSTEPSATDPAGSLELLDVDNSSSGVSKGAIAGIATTVTAIIVGACAALMSFLYVRHRKKQNEVEEIAIGTGFHQKPMSELSSEELLAPKTLWTHTTELSSESMVHEAGSGERPPELDHMAFRAELEGSQPPTPK